MRNPQREEKKRENWNPKVVDSDFLTHHEDCIVWLGHASFFIRIEGVTLLIDPVLFDVSYFKRKSRLPIKPEELNGIDYILISHDHRDHCDERSLKLLSKQNPKARYLTGLNLDTLLTKITGSKDIQAAGWYQQYKLDDALQITYMPARHWGRRGLNDTNKRLWGGFVIQGAGKTLYFSADSGYGSHFADAGKVFSNIDYCLIGIGAYKPEFFMGQSHASPQDAVKAANEMDASYMIPMHYGTFDLSDEPLGDPIQVLHKINRDGKLRAHLCDLKHGEMQVLKQAKPESV